MLFYCLSYILALKAITDIMDMKGNMMTTKISSVDAKNNWGDTISRVQYGKERIAVTKKGKSAVAIVSLDDLELLEQIEQIEDELDIKLALERLKEAKEADKISWEEVKKELGF